MVMLLHSHTEVQRGKQRKHISLQERYQQFQRAHKYGKCNGRYGYSITRYSASFTENKYKAEESENNNVARGNVGE